MNYIKIIIFITTFNQAVFNYFKHIDKFAKTQYLQFEHLYPIFKIHIIKNIKYLRYI